MVYTGNAIEKLDNAQEVAAKCAYQGLTKDQSVTVKQNDDGPWSVTGVVRPLYAFTATQERQAPARVVASATGSVGVHGHDLW